MDQLYQVYVWAEDEKGYESRWIRYGNPTTMELAKEESEWLNDRGRVNVIQKVKMPNEQDEE